MGHQTVTANVCADRVMLVRKIEVHLHCIAFKVTRFSAAVIELLCTVHTGPIWTHSEEETAHISRKRMQRLELAGKRGRSRDLWME